MVNADCIDRHGGEPFVCMQDSLTCVSLATPNCEVHAEQSDIRNDHTVWLGVVYPKSGSASTEGAMRIAAVELARQEIRQRVGVLPPVTTGGPSRPLGFVVCDEAAAAPTAHLIDDLHVRAILGFMNPDTFTAAIPGAAANGVLLMAAGPSSPSTADAGPPRLLWRTTPSDTLGALAMAKAVTAVEGVAARTRAGPLRVALVSNDSTIAKVLTRNVSINGKAFVDAGDSALAIAYGAAPSDAELASVAEKLTAFHPDIVLAFGGAVVGPRIVDTVETASIRPLYVLNGAALPSLTQRLVANSDLRHRTVVVDLDSSRPSFSTFRAALAAASPEVPSPAATLGTTYDAVYALTYSVVARDAVREEVRDGAALANAIPWLTRGQVIHVGPADLPAGFNALVEGRTIDLDGVSGPLDFNPSTGEVNADMEIGCISSSGGVAPSGAIFRYAGGTLEGQISCP
jgi:branched-chain amino acid transport system substrate-binding protein